MKTLWDKGKPLDQTIADFTVGDDRVLDAHLARQDVLGSLAHVACLHDAGLLSDADAGALTEALRDLYTEAEAGRLAPGPQDEDIHSALERLLTARLGDAGKRVHTARSRNDQVATDLALWMREQAHGAHADVLSAAQAALTWAERHANVPLPGMTHLQPAMPSTFGLWAGAWAALWLDDAALLRAAYDATDANPLGSAAGYGVPADLAPLDRAVSTAKMGFARQVAPVTAVQAGRGKPEATLLFGLAQASNTCARMARDLVFYVHPSMGYVRLPARFTTGSSIMPQKRNPDVMELTRARASVVQAALGEVMSLAASVPSGYHRDFQLLKAPLMRGVQSARETLQVVAHVFPGLEVNAEAAARACTPALFATHRALALVTQGVPFRDAYAQVAAEVDADALPDTTPRTLPDAAPALDALRRRIDDAQRWSQTQHAHLSAVEAGLLGQA